MVDIGMMVGALQSANGAVQVLRAAIETRDNVKISEALADTMSKLMAANTAALDLQNRLVSLTNENHSLVAEVKRLTDWNAQKAHYRLKAVGVDKVLVYEMLEAERGSAPEHFLCATCFDRGEKSILQPDSRMPGRDEFLVCGSCGADLLTQGVRRAEHGKVPARRR